jgi:eukaryotic-like serine/threonine-protein kinase
MMTVVGEEFGPYLVYEQIGLGGMASVHRAESQGIAGFRRPVALKRMLPWVAANDELVRSFVREARLASHLRHANVAQTLDLGKVGDTYFIAMELVPGKNLREILSQCARVVGAMPIANAIAILTQIADALDYAHNLCDETGTPLGIIHRDVSPSNVIVSDGGIVKLIDFGIAKATAQSMQTMSRTIKGKFGYMAPEYIEGRIDARADLFALGVIAHELLANRPLFQGSDEMDTLHNVRAMRIDPPSRFNAKVPPELDAIVMTALERDPDRRWQGANAFRTALTNEAKQLGLVALGPQLFEWIEWAFSRQEKGDFTVETQPEISIGTEEIEEITARPSAPHPRLVKRASAPPPNEFSDDQRTILMPPKPKLLAEATPAPLPPPPTAPSIVLPIAPPIASAPSGARTNRLPTAEPVDAVLRDLDERSSVYPPPESAVSAAMTQIKPGGVRRRGLLLAILVLLAAAGTAAVVYFALPYFT